MARDEGDKQHHHEDDINLHQHQQPHLDRQQSLVVQDGRIVRMGACMSTPSAGADTAAFAPPPTDIRGIDSMSQRSGVSGSGRGGSSSGGGSLDYLKGGDIVPFRGEGNETSLTDLYSRINNLDRMDEQDRSDDDDDEEEEDEEESKDQVGEALGGSGGVNAYGSAGSGSIRTLSMSSTSCSVESSRCSSVSRKGGSSSRGGGLLLRKNSSRKIAVSTLPRHSRRNKPKKEMTWLRDTLSLNSSVHSDHIISLASDPDLDVDMEGSEGEFGGLGSSSGSGRSKKAEAALNRHHHHGHGHGGHHSRTASSPACLASFSCLDFDMDVPKLFPSPSNQANNPLPAILGSSVSSDEVSSVGQDDPPAEKALEGIMNLEDAEADEEEDESSKEEEEKDDPKATLPTEEKEEENEAPIKWITATIPTGEELPPPPPRESPRSSRGSAKSSRGSPTSTRKNRWGSESASPHHPDEQQRPSPSPTLGEVGRMGGSGRERFMDGSGGDRGGSVSRSHYTEGVGGSRGPSPSPRPEQKRFTPPPMMEDADDDDYRPGRRRPDDRPPSRQQQLGSASEIEYVRGGSIERYHHEQEEEELPRRHSRERSPTRPGDDRQGSFSREGEMMMDGRRPPPRDRSPPGRRQPRDIHPRDRSPDRYYPPRSSDRYPPRDWDYPPPEQRRGGGGGGGGHGWRGDPYDRWREEPPRRRGDARDWRGRDGHDRRDPYYHEPRRDDRRMSPRYEYDEYDRYQHGDPYRSSPAGQLEVHIRSRDNYRPPISRDEPYHHHERPPYDRYEEDRYYSRGRGGGGPGDRGYPSHYSRDHNPAYDDYPGPPPPSQDMRGANDRNTPRSSDPYGRSAPQQESNPGLDSRYGQPSRELPPKTSRSDQDLVEEKLKNGGGKLGQSPGGAKDEPVSVEISPGVRVPLRRTHETMEAIAVDFYQSVSCFGCAMDIFCIADVSYVICPKCRVISPVSGEYFEGRDIKRHGLGLGFTCESLFKMQAEILQDRTKYDKDPKKEEPKQHQYHVERRGPAHLQVSQY